MLIKIIEPDFKFKDERGDLVQLTRTGFKQFNYIFSKKDVIRGNHYHKKNNEAFYVISGKFTLNVKKDDIEETYTFKTGDMFLVPPFVIHSFIYLEDTLLNSMYDLGVENEDGTKDIYS